MKKYIVNVTFVLDHKQRRRFLEWIDEAAIPNLFHKNAKARNPRLQKVIEVGGEKIGPEHGLSMALQAEFDSAEDAHTWCDTLLKMMLGAYYIIFGSEALFFVTMLESKDLR